MKTRVLITIDTEFSIGGAFRNPQANRPVGPENVYCPAQGRAEGLEFLLYTLQLHQIRAVFFVETLNTFFFGDAPMGEIAQKIHARRHELQLHLHPVWYLFKDPDWAQALTQNPPNDDFCRRTPQQMVQAIDDGLQVFQRWGLPLPTTLRTGSMRVNPQVYAAMNLRGMKASSNVAMGIYTPSEAQLHLYSGAHQIHGIWELPILSYRESSMRVKSLTITGSSWAEIEYLLLQAHRLGLPYVVLLTHPFEFVKNQSERMEHAKRNRIKQYRFQRLCQFLSRNKDRFESAVFNEVSADFDAHAGSGNALLSVPARLSAWRVVQNKLNAISWT